MSSKILSAEFDKLKADLIQAYDAKGMRASGKFADSLEVVVNGLNAKLMGENYAEQLEFGRKAGKFPPVSLIEQWIKDKGIASRISNDISISSLAFLIARKIAREGWNRQEHGGVQLISEIVTEERMQKIIDEVGAAQTLIFKSEIINLVKEMAV